MPDTIFIQLDARPEEQPRWIRTDGRSEQPMVREDSWEDLAGEARGCRVVAFVPATDVLLTVANVPSRRRQRVARAVPYVLEEQLAADVDELHFALGTRPLDSGAMPTAVVARAGMDAWMEQLQAAGIQPDVLVPDVLALPLREGCWTALRLPDDTVAVRTGREAGFAVDTPNFADVARRAMAECEASPAEIDFINCGDGPVQADRLADGADVAVRERDCDGEALVLLAGGFDPGSGINLLQGDYRRRDTWSVAWRPWLPAAAIAAAWLVLHAGMGVADYVRLSAEERDTRERIETLYFDTFPDARKVVNPRVQTERRLEALRDASKQGAQGFLGLLASTGEVLRGAEGMELHRLSYKDGRMDLDVAMKDLQVLDRLKQQLMTRSHLEVDVQSATTHGNEVRTRMRIRGAER